MTYRELINHIEEVAISQPSVNSVIQDDVYLLNTQQNARYGVFAWTQGQHNAEAVADEVRFAFNLFYIDRLSDGDTNKIDIYATGIATLANIIKALSDKVGVSSYTLQPFTQKFLDQCAGVYASLTISASVDTICAHSYTDFKNDFNDDYNNDYY